MTEPTSSGPGDLSFDKAIPAAAAAGAVATGVKCANCGQPITDSYHTVNGLTICGNCRAILEKATASAIELPVLGKSLVFGIGAAIAGAIIYWAVMEFTGLVIGLVAILTGWMVGTAMRKGADGRGSRVLQVASAILVYFSVAAAYMPFAFANLEGGMSPIGGAIAAAVMLFTLPLLAVIGSLPGSLISGLIIGFGIMQAWRMTGRLPLEFRGPFRVGGAVAP